MKKLILLFIVLAASLLLYTFDTEATRDFHYSNIRVDGDTVAAFYHESFDNDPSGVILYDVNSTSRQKVLIVEPNDSDCYDSYNDIPNNLPSTECDSPEYECSYSRMDRLDLRGDYLVVNRWKTDIVCEEETYINYIPNDALVDVSDELLSDISDGYGLPSPTSPAYTPPSIPDDIIDGYSDPANFEELTRASYTRSYTSEVVYYKLSDGTTEVISDEGVRNAHEIWTLLSTDANKVCWYSFSDDLVNCYDLASRSSYNFRPLVSNDEVFHTAVERGNAYTILDIDTSSSDEEFVFTKHNFSTGLSGRVGTLSYYHPEYLRSDSYLSREVVSWTSSPPHTVYYYDSSTGSISTIVLGGDRSTVASDIAIDSRFFRIAYIVRDESDYNVILSVNGSSNSVIKSSTTEKNHVAVDGDNLIWTFKFDGSDNEKVYYYNLSTGSNRIILR